MKIMLGILLASVAIPAFAADMPLKARAPAPPYTDWSGFYIGIHGGYGWGKVEPDNFDGFDPFGNPKPKGWVLGGQAGYLMQWGSVVGGFEVDGSFARIKETQTLTATGVIRIDDFAIPAKATASLESKIDALASARVRLGYLLTPNLLAYGTGGLAWGRAKGTVGFELCVKDKCTSDSISDSDTGFGWAAGAGFEYQFANNWRFGVEYLHYDLGTLTFFDGSDVKANVDVVRGRFSLRF